MTVFQLLQGRVWLALAVGLALSACGSKSVIRAPVEDRPASGTHAVASATAHAAAPAPAPGTSTAPAAAAKAVVPDADNAGKPGYYSVKQGDTLIRIGLESGQSHRDIARWNNLDNPNKIEIGQVLRVIPPGTAEDVAVTKPVLANKVTTTPLVAAAPAKAASAAGTPAPTAVASAPASSSLAIEEEIVFVWPSKGEVLATFDEAKNRKGLDIAGAAGEPVLAAADGKVVYAGSGLRGYGNLVILKHNGTYLTAYAHNQVLFVKEEQSVKQGQKIAEMGNSDADRVKLHFEVRKMGKPVDPAKFLPVR